MKQLTFNDLFANLQVFYILAGLIFLNAVLATWIAVKEKNFQWSKLTDFLKLIIVGMIYLAVGNLVDWVTKTLGYDLTIAGIDIQGIGFGVASATLLGKEVGKIKVKLAKIGGDPEPPKPETN